MKGVEIMIYITGDTHRELDIHTINPDEFVQGRNLTRDDYVIIAGDFGCIWDGAEGDNFWLKWIDSLPWTTLFIDGNHENFDLLNSYPEKVWHGGKVHQIRDNIYHLKRGELFSIDDKQIFVFGGGFSHDYQYRVEHRSWWKDELPTRQEVDHAIERLDDIHWKVDYVITHDIYRSSLFTYRYSWSMLPYGSNYVDIHSFLDDINDRLDYKVWYHGHYHADEVHYDKKGRPAVCLFNKIIPLDNWEQVL